MLHLLASLTWDPGIRGILDVAIAVAVLCGTPLILLATNVGSRLGFHIAMTGLFGWLTIMFLIWGIYGLGYHGPEPSWKVQEVSTDPAAAVETKLHSAPQPSDLGVTPDDLLASSDTASKELEGRSNITIGDIVAVDPGVATDLQPKLNGWKIVSSADGVYGDTSSTAGEFITSDEAGTFKFDGSSDFLVTDVFQQGGKPERKNDSMSQRVANRIQTTAMWFIADNPTHYAVVQLQATVPQTSLPGEPPPTPVLDENAPVINVLMVRDLGAVRQPAIALAILSFISFVLLAYSLHRRDEEGMENRRAAAAVGSGV